jgi:hypothetical protein
VNSNSSSTLAANSFLDLALCQVSQSPGFRLLRFQQKGRFGYPLRPGERKTRRGSFLRAFSVDGLIQLLSSISLQALPYSSWAEPQYQTDRRQMLFHAATLVRMLYALNQTRAFLAISWKSYNFYSCFNFIKL